MRPLNKQERESYDWMVNTVGEAYMGILSPDNYATWRGVVDSMRPLTLEDNTSENNALYIIARTAVSNCSQGLYGFRESRSKRSAFAVLRVGYALERLMQNRYATPGSIDIYSLKF